MSVETVFRFFNEVGIINQLSSASFNRRLPEGLHVSHFSILNHLCRLGDGKTPLELASAFQVSKSTMTHSLGVLIKRDFIDLKPHETDGRSKLVFLTPEGREFRDHAIQLLAPTILALSEKLDIEQITKVLPALEKVRKVLDENRNV